jgi:uncharacterized protein DUF6065
MSAGASERTSSLELIAFHTSPRVPVRIAPAPLRRSWMEETRGRWAYKCLPLVVANEAGWFLLNEFRFEAVWSGEDHPGSIEIDFFDSEVPSPRPVRSFFGYGVLTWAVPYLFRTPPGYNLLARGPANWPKDGISALEGLVETDWSVTTFTMNWRFTRPGHSVGFEAGEPYCMIVPQRRGELELFRPCFRDIHSDPRTARLAKEAVETRHQAQVRKFLSLYSTEYEADKDAWEGTYLRGLYPDGTKAPSHQTRLHLADFRARED